MQLPYPAQSLPMGALKAALLRGLQTVSPARQGRAAGRAWALEPERWPAERWKQLGRQITALHDAYTGGTQEFSHDQNPIHTHLEGYQFYFMPRNFYRVLYTLHELPWRPWAGAALLEPWLETGPGQPALSVLDLGCGTGAFSLAVLAWLARLGLDAAALPALRLTLVDQGRALMGVAEATLRAFAARALPGLALTVQTHADGVARFLAAPGAGRYAIVGSALMLNEMHLLTSGRSGRRALRFTDPLKRLSRPGGLLLLVEAGTRKGYMNLVAVREQLLPAPVLYPCPHGEDCPLWDARASRWCHSTRPLPRDFFFDDDLRRRAGLTFRMRDLNLAALAVQAGGGDSVAPPFMSRNGVRVVSGLLRPRPEPRPKRRPEARPERQPVVAGAAAPVSVVLQCAPDGQLREVPDPGLGAYPRGVWMDVIPARVQAPASPRAPARKPRGRKR
jgi:SAM-dependent methyltransferase